VLVKAIKAIRGAVAVISGRLQLGLHHEHSIAIKANGHSKGPGSSYQCVHMSPACVLHALAVDASVLHATLQECLLLWRCIALACVLASRDINY
jgi:hypothetical protein